MTPASPSTFPDGYSEVALGPDDRARVLDLDHWAFPDPHGPTAHEGHPLPLTWERTFGVVDDSEDLEAVPVDGAVPHRTELVALHSSYPFSQFPVPGGTLPVAGLTWVGVHPQHRRRGILTAMISAHLDRCRAAGEPVSALFAAEAGIYGRFGYGRAADDLRVTVPRGSALRDVPGAARHTVRIEHADRARHADLVADLHVRAGATAGGTAPDGSPVNRPGWATRETPELQDVSWDDHPAYRDGRETQRIVIVEADGEPRGYARFRRKVSWQDAGPRGTVSTGEVVALDAAAARALWGVLLDLDLTSEVAPFVLPVDDVVRHLLVDPRVAVPKVADNVWVRIVDLPTALAGRRYAGDLDVVLHVTDALVLENAGRWRVRTTAFGPATCEPTEDSADLSLDVRELGAVYLGGVSLTALAASGLVTTHTPGALAAASAAFGWPVAPVCSWIF